MDLYKHMRKKYPYAFIRAIRLDEYGKTGKIAEFHGGGMSKEVGIKNIAGNTIMKLCLK